MHEMDHQASDDYIFVPCFLVEEITQSSDSMYPPIFIFKIMILNYKITKLLLPTTFLRNTYE